MSNKNLSYNKINTLSKTSTNINKLLEKSKEKLSSKASRRLGIIKIESSNSAKDKRIIEYTNDINILNEYKEKTGLSIRVNRLREKVKQIHDKNKNQQIIKEEMMLVNEEDMFNYTKLEITNPLSIHMKNESQSNKNIIDKIKINNPNHYKMKLVKPKKTMSLLNKKGNEIIDRIENIIDNFSQIKNSNLVSVDNNISNEEMETEENNSDKENFPMAFRRNSVNLISRKSFGLNNDNYCKTESNEHQSVINNFSSKKSNYINKIKIETSYLGYKEREDINKTHSVFKNISSKDTLRKLTLNIKSNFLKNYMKIRNDDKFENSDKIKISPTDKKYKTDPYWKTQNLTKESFNNRNLESERRQKFDMLFANEYLNILQKIETSKNKEDIKRIMDERKQMEIEKLKHKYLMKKDLQIFLPRVSNNDVEKMYENYIYLDGDR